MSHDRELLELAAKATGWVLVHVLDGPCRGCQFIDGKSAAWNPLTSDADALRLAVKLHMLVDVGLLVPETEVIGGEVGNIGNATECHVGDPLAATRRAIVRAAAAIGEKMP